MSKIVAAFRRLFGKERPASHGKHDQTRVTLRDPAWLIRSSGWAPVAAVRGAEPFDRRR